MTTFQPSAANLRLQKGAQGHRSQPWLGHPCWTLQRYADRRRTKEETKERVLYKQANILVNMAVFDSRGGGEFDKSGQNGVVMSASKRPAPTPNKGTSSPKNEN